MFDDLFNGPAALFAPMHAAFAANAAPDDDEDDDGDETPTQEVVINPIIPY
jgi:hypothetical protein